MCDRPTEEFAISIVANFVAPSSQSALGSVGSADELECVFMFKRYFINKSQPTRYNRFNECMNPTINGDGQESSVAGIKGS